MNRKTIPSFLLLSLVIATSIFMTRCTDTKTPSAVCMNLYATMGTHNLGAPASPSTATSPQDSTQPSATDGTRASAPVYKAPNDSSSGTGFCTGTGICSASQTQTSADQIPINICGSSEDTTVATITFSMSALKQKQPDHVQYIENKTEYMFGADYTLPDTACKKLGYHLNTKIQGNKPGKIKINADTVVITMPIEK